MKRLVLFVSLALLAACGKAETAVMQGYGEADYIYLSSQESGIVSELLVREGDTVEAGAPIFRLDADRMALSAEGADAQRGALAQAAAAARANAVLAQRTYARGAELAERGFYPRQRLDVDRAALDAANANLAQAQRQVSAAGAETGLARQRLSDLQGQAPAAGTIEQIFRRPGEVVAAGAPIAALLTPDNFKVRFFAPEAMLAQLSVGARVLISCDGCGEAVPARVSFVAREPQFTPPIIYSLEQRDKLVYLVEARPEQRSTIRPGVPVDVRIAQ